ncbi:MAG: DNA (cytosine-5-)-methyltransferase [Rhodospirillales bacterium]|nr:DNA (cytosine-5-)-methyltransferase [Rhodospirillales bacterium]
MAYDISTERRQQYREMSIRSQQRKRALLERDHSKRKIKVNVPRLSPSDLMPIIPPHGLSALSLFSGGGGLDLGFERAGYNHVASFDILDVCGATLRANRPDWNVFSGEQTGDVTQVDWRAYRGVDLVHGGPPCQPFSIAGKQAGPNDPRNMWPAFVASVLAAKPKAFVAENVPGLLDPKFKSFVDENVISPLGRLYHLTTFRVGADEFGVPQTRKRVFIVGFRNAAHARRFARPTPTHSDEPGDLAPLNKTRHSLGLSNIGFDAVAPTLRSGFTGPRNTTGVVNSKASLLVWNKLRIWPNGVQHSRESAAVYPPENGHLRLSVPDCALLQGFPCDWIFEGAVYQALGQIGNSVCPPVGYKVALAVARALGAIQ